MQFLEKINRLHILIGIIILIIAIPLTLYLVRQQQILRSRAAGGAVNLSLTPNQGEKVQGQEFTADLIIGNVGRAVATGDPITGVDITLKFNKRVFDLVFTPNASIFDTELKNTHPPQSNPCDPLAPGTDCVFQFSAIHTTRAAGADSSGNVKIGTLTLRPKILTTDANNGNITLDAVQIVGARIDPALSITPSAGTLANFRISSAVISPTPTVSITPTPSPTIGPTTCTCQTNNTCSAPCAVNQSTNRLTGKDYEAQMFCVREIGLEERQSSPPSSADKLEYCQRATRPRGDADGRADSRGCQVNRQDYLFYLSSVIRARIPAGVNADFDGSGQVSPNDLSIWERGRCDNI